MSKIWRLAEQKVERIDFPDHLSPLAITLLRNRQILDPEAIREFLEPSYERDVHDPFLFRDMDRVVTRIFEAIKKAERIALFGDYDADGVCSSVVLTTTLKALGGNVVDVYLPHREKEGYGLNAHAVEDFARGGVTLLITLDCGTTNTAEILLAQEKGIDVVVIDHHHVPDELPGAFALLNPKMPNETYPFRFLASVGMAFKVSQALFRHASKIDSTVSWEAFEKWLLDLVAIATVTDMVPLTGENRTLLKYGLMVLNKTTRPGLSALINAMGGELGSLDTFSIAFQIGPRINAAGRMNHANAAYELLVCDKAEQSRTLAFDLNEENQRRQALTERITAEAKSIATTQQEQKVLVIVGDGWPTGLVGLVASRIMDIYHRPTFVIGRNDRGLTGSGRSIPSFNIIEALHTMPELFTKFGGHAQACGFTLKDEASITQFSKRLNDLADAALTEEQLQPVITIDAAIMLKDVQRNLWETLQQFEPFGMLNPKPKFLFSNIRIVGLGAVGATGQHLKLTLSDEQGSVKQAIGFRLGERQSEFRLGDAVDVVAEIMMNEWNGNRELQLKIIDLRKTL